AFGIEEFGSSLVWMAREGGDINLDIRDFDSLASNIKKVLLDNNNRKIRIVLDSLSSSLMLNDIETTYKFTDLLIDDVKKHEAILLATFEDGMHHPTALAAMQQLFDGAIELSLHRFGYRILPLLRVVKMRGIKVDPIYFKIAFEKTGIRLDDKALQLESFEITNTERTGEKFREASTFFGLNGGTSTVFNYLAKSFIDDYSGKRLSAEQAGWRTRGSISEATNATQISLYGKAGKFGPILKDLLSSGVVEMRYFPGQRGRGGEVVKFRIAYEKEHVKRFLDNSISNQESSYDVERST
ncbi:MAG TPA: hypothetical protein VN739_03310, partial [Nitrososphaerales archaeon]|nr:hypothetical protein [Nitrososphaerales archaeon]